MFVGSRMPQEMLRLFRRFTSEKYSQGIIQIAEAYLHSVDGSKSDVARSLRIGGSSPGKAAPEADFSSTPCTLASKEQENEKQR